MGFDKGFLSAYFVTDFDSQEAVLEDALVLLHREKISSLPDLLPLLEKVAEAGKPLLIVAEDVDGEALSTLVVNSIRKTLKAVAVKAPFFGDRRKAFLDDLAVVTGGQVVNPDVGLILREVGLEVLGTARRVVVNKDSTVIVDGGGTQEAIDGRKAQLRAEIENSDLTGTARSSKSGWPSWPAASPSSGSAPQPRPTSRSAKRRSRTPSPRPRPPWKKASSSAAVRPWCRPGPASTTCASP